MRTAFVLFAAFSAAASAAMPPAEQNALVRQYCAVCHTDRANNGGLSLEHYDAARPDPGLAAMMLSKFNNGAMGAAGNGVPGKAAQQAWTDSTTEQSAHAAEWFVSREGDTISAGIVREVPPRLPQSTNAPLYRIQLVCSAATGSGKMLLTWSPQPQTDRSFTVSVDDKPPVEYTITGLESMGNGASVKTGRASLVLTSGSDRKLPLAADSLTVHGLFPNENVTFPFHDLDNSARSQLSKCF